VDAASRPGHTTPFIARLTRAHPNFEVKDGPKGRRRWRPTVLEFKIRMRFPAAMR